MPKLELPEKTWTWPDTWYVSKMGKRATVEQKKLDWLIEAVERIAEYLNNQKTIYVPSPRSQNEYREEFVE